MPRVYSDTGAALHPYTFDEKTLVGIGRLIRACADLEDALNVYLAKLTGIAEHGLGVLLGKSPVTTKVRMAKTFAESCSAAELAAFNSFFGAGFSDCLRCRNSVAHGMLLGITDTGHISFAVQELIEGESFGVIAVNGYEPTAFAEFADAAEQTLKNLDAQLKLSALREKRREQPLDPHKKAQPKAKRHGQQKRPRRSSRR